MVLIRFCSYCSVEQQRNVAATTIFIPGLRHVLYRFYKTWQGIFRALVEMLKYNPIPCFNTSQKSLIYLLLLHMETLLMMIYQLLKYVRELGRETTWREPRESCLFVFWQQCFEENYRKNPGYTGYIINSAVFIKRNRTVNPLCNSSCTSVFLNYNATGLTVKPISTLNRDCAVSIKGCNL
jgi:hypothetical protein